MSEGCQFELARPDERNEWNRFVADNRGSIFHTWEWLEVLGASGFHNESVRISRGSETFALLPLVSVEKFGVRKGFSLPFLPAGLLGKTSAATLEGLMTFLRSRNLHLVQLRAYDREPASLPWLTAPDVIVPLSGGEDAVLAAMDKTHRWSIRKAIRSGLRLRELTTASDASSLWPLYQLTMDRRQSGGSYWPELFEALFTLPVEHRRVTLALKDDKPIAFTIFLRYGEKAFYFANGSDGDYFEYCANHWLLWQDLLWARALGCTTAHLGAGPAVNDSLYRYKLKFGGRPASSYSTLIALSKRGNIAKSIEEVLSDDLKRRLKGLILRRSAARS